MKKARAPKKARKAMPIGLEGMILPFVDRFVKGGKRPAFKELMKEGGFGPARPEHPTAAQTDRAVIPTGAYPGIFETALRVPGGPLEMAPAAAGSRFHETEYLWQDQNPHFASTHSNLLPSGTPGTGTIEALYLFKGPEVRGGRRNPAPIRPNHIAPAMSRGRNIPAPARADGTAIYDLFRSRAGGSRGTAASPLLQPAPAASGAAEAKYAKEGRIMKRTWLHTAALGFASFFLLASSGLAQYPEKPVNLLLGWGAGGATDTTLRALSEAAGKALGQPIVVLNKPGGGSAVALAALKNEKPDGYTIGNISAAGILSQYMRKVPYDSLSDFTPIMRYGDYTFGVVVQKDAPWKTFKEVVEHAKANPGKIRYSTSGAGSFHHLAMEALAKQEGIKWVHIPYKGGHEATTAILGGHVDVEACSSEWKPYVDSGRLRLLATYNPQRLARYPDAPTWVDLGYKIAASSLVGVVGPKGLAQPVVDKLHNAFKQGLEDPTFKKTMESLDMPVIYRDPAGLYRDMKGIADMWGKMIVDMGLRQE